MEPKDEIKQKLDIVEVIGGYLQLKPAGSGSFKAVCPFHSEKTPSFYVSQEKQIWHCFGCDKGGDLISFVMDIEGIDFIAAIKQLGKKAGVEVDDLKPDLNRDEKQVILDLNELACRFYEKILESHSLGSSVRAYLEERKIDRDLQKKFRLGAAPDGWNSLCEFLFKRGATEKQVVSAGLAKEKQSGDGLIDKFRNRLMIPLHDPAGKVIGFTARLLIPIDEKTGPKYLNSPETLIYHKSDVLYGFYLAKKAIRVEKSVIIVEGNLDVIASHKAGVENVVASSGTALTESQLRQLKKITNKLLFCFDSDAAGFAAAKRGIKLAQEMDFNVQVISIPNEVGKDPDDVVRKNPEAWRKLVNKPTHIMQYFIDRSLESVNLSDVESKRIFITNVLGVLSNYKDVVVREHWLRQVADITHTDIGVLRNLLVPSGVKSLNKAEFTTTEGVGKNKLLTRSERAAEIVIGIILNDHSFIKDVINEIKTENIPLKYREVYKNILLTYNQGVQSESAQNSKNNIFNRLPDQQKEEVRGILLKTQMLTEQMSEIQVRDELFRQLEVLNNALSKAQRALLESDIRQAEMSGNKEKLQKLLEEYKELL